MTSVAVFGYGGFLAVAVFLVLFIGLGTATRNTSELLQARAQEMLQNLGSRLSATMLPVTDQARWIESFIVQQLPTADKRLDLDTFMRGALAATPQITGLGLVSPDAVLRRWSREDGSIVVEDWSNQPPIVEWLADSRLRTESRWSRPLWTHTLGRTVVFHETPLHRGGLFLGVLVQVLPIEELSRVLSDVALNTGMMPFVLYGNDYVLAHPLLSHARFDAGSRDIPLARIAELGDPALVRLRGVKETPYFLRGLEGVRSAFAEVDGHELILLETPIEAFGTLGWTMGVHFDAKLVGGDEPKRIDRASEVGLATLLVAITIAVFAGRRFARPIKLLATAAEAVGTNQLDAVPELPRSRVREVDMALLSFQQMVQGLRERLLIRDMLGRFVPESVAHTLLAGGGTLEPEQSEATLLFSDLQGFTSLTERVGPAGIVALLNAYFEAMVAVLERHGGIVTQFQGDAILATFNVPLSDPDHATNALNAALEMQDVVNSRSFAGEPLVCRIGINTGIVVAGAVGAKGRLTYTVHGDAVNLAARLEALNKEHDTRILVSGNTASRVQGFALRRVGEVTARGQTRPVDLFELEWSAAGDPCTEP